MILTRAREWTLIVVVAGVAAAAGIGYSLWNTAPREAASDAVSVMLAADIPDLEGKLQSLKQWQGKVVVINFWATWCAPCREEIPILIRIQEKYRSRGLQFVGLAIDHPDKVRPYAAELGMNFPVLIGGIDAIEVTRQLGNRAGVLPFTVILDRNGKIAATEVGAAKESKLEALLSSLF